MFEDFECTFRPRYRYTNYEMAFSFKFFRIFYNTSISLNLLPVCCGDIDFKDKSIDQVLAGKSGLIKGQCHEIFDFWFFHESVSPSP
jgi:hypothetical protein